MGSVVRLLFDNSCEILSWSVFICDVYTLVGFRIDHPEVFTSDLLYVCRTVHAFDLYIDGLNIS